MKAAIVILNYNGEKHLRNFLPSAVKYCPDWAEVIVADNASTDGSVAMLSTEFPEVRRIILDQNYGFAGGYNKALAQVEATYFALVNNDLEVTEGWLDVLVKTLDNDEEIAAIQPKIKDYNKRQYFDYAGASGGFIDLHGYPFCRGRIFDHCERDIGQHNDPREVFWATGACMVIRSASFREIGGFDGALFAHMEEIDLCWRLKNRGRRIYCNPAAVVYHVGGGTLNKQHPRKTYLNFRNNLIVVIKNDYRNRFWGKLLKRMLLDAVAAFRFLFLHGPHHFLAVLRAHLYLHTHFRQLLRQRKSLRAAAGYINRTGLFKGNIVKEFFLRKKRVFGSLESARFVRTNRRHADKPESIDIR